MRTIFHIAFLFTIGRCTDIQNFTIKTVHVGEDVTLTCSRRPGLTGCLFWTKLAAGNLPKVLGSTYTFDRGTIKNTPHFTVRHEPGTFVLHIIQTKLSDTAFYYCEEVVELQKTFLNVTFLRVKGPGSGMTASIQEFPSAPVHLGDSVTLQCSVLSESENQVCPGYHNLFSLQAGAAENQPNATFANGNSGDKCRPSLEVNNPHVSDYIFSMDDIGSVDIEICCCALANCGQILCGKRTKLETGAPESLSDSHWTTIILLLCGALAISLIIIVLRLYTIKKQKKSNYGNAAAADAGLTDEENQRAEEEGLIYSLGNFSKKKSTHRGRKGNKEDEQETIYSDVRVL